MKLSPENTPPALHPWIDDLNALYAIYIRVMAIKRRRADIRGWRRVTAWLYVAYGYCRDVWFNLTTAADIFQDPAQELTVTARLKRYRESGSWQQQALAAFLCDQVLDQHDPYGDHC